MTEPYLTKKKALIAIATVVSIILFGLLCITDFGRSGIKAIGSLAYAIIAGIVGVTFVIAPIFIWLGTILAIFATGIYLILWSFKIYRPRAKTEEQALQMLIRHKKYGNFAKVLGFVLIGLLVYYFIR